MAVADPAHPASAAVDFRDDWALYAPYHGLSIQSSADMATVSEWCPRVV